MSNYYSKRRISAEAMQTYIAEKNAKHEFLVKKSLERSLQTRKEMDEKNPGRIEKYRNEVEDFQNKIDVLTEELQMMVASAKEVIGKDIGKLTAAEIVKKHADILKVIEQKSDKHLEQVKIKHSNATTQYLAYLFNDLYELDNEFIHYVPVKCFKATDNTHHRKSELFTLKYLSVDELKKLENRILSEDKNITKDQVFRNIYAKYFESQINTLTDLNDVKACLKLYPQAYPKLKDAIKNQLKAPNEIANIACRAPQVFLYMSDKEIEEYAIRNVKNLASAILRAPEILEKLDNKFFERHDPRYMFSNYSKSVMKQAFGEYALLHKKLNDFISFRQDARQQKMISTVFND